MKKLVMLRRSSQASFFALFVYILWSTTYPLTGLIHPETVFRLDPLVMLITCLSERIILPGLTLSIIMVALAAVFGRFFCGWVCPLGASIDMSGSMRRRHGRPNDRTNAVLRIPKFVLLGVIIVVAIFGTQVAWVFDPIALAARFVSLNLIPAVTAIFKAAFVFIIRDLKIEGPVLELYRALKPSVLGVKASYFPNGPVILAYFIAVMAAALAIPRLWCRSICPLGAVYSIAGSASPMRRIVDECKKCERCSSECRMGAIKMDMSYARSECILCMDCVYTCPVRGVRFGFGRRKPGEAGRPAQEGKGGLSRKEFIVLILSSLTALGFRRDPGKGRSAGEAAPVIRPPAALGEKDFTDRCVRCGNCMKVCITNGLQPVMLEAGYGGIWTPKLVPEIGYCEYKCTLCGDTCPTGAIPEITLQEKMDTRLGVAEIDASICLPYAEGKECLVCQEHCPVAEKAIELDHGPKPGVMRPRVIEELCVGCGICENKCPVRPARAIRVSPRGAGRTGAVAGKRRAPGRVRR